jgi:hypothetical protein
MHNAPAIRQLAQLPNRIVSRTVAHVFARLTASRPTPPISGRATAARRDAVERSAGWAGSAANSKDHWCSSPLQRCLAQLRPSRCICCSRFRKAPEVPADLAPVRTARPVRYGCAVGHSGRRVVGEAPRSLNNLFPSAPKPTRHCHICRTRHTTRDSPRLPGDHPMRSLQRLTGQ